ncbi:hypothetical protein OAP77_01635 [Planctomycetota bacterium]|nr:hypothetical protein [Planctomycetota bacterium]
MKNLITTCIAACGLLLGSTAFAGVGDATMSVANTTASVGASFTMTAVLDNNIGDVQGWSYGLCHTASLATVDSVDDADTATVKSGSPADFNEKSTFADGFTQGVVICFTGCAVIPSATTGFQMATGNYTATTEGTGSVGYCGTLGSPPTAVVVVVGGASIPPTESNGTLTIVGVPDPEFNFIAGSSAGNNYPAAGGIGGQTFNVGFSIEEVDNSASGGLFPSDSQGFSLGFASDDALVTPVAVNVTLPFTADFAEDSVFTNGWTLGVVYAFIGGVELQFDSAIEVVNVDYEGVAGALAGVEGTSTSPLTMDSGLGDPPVSNVVVVGGGSFGATGVSGSLEFTGTTTNPFNVGDCNADGLTNIADIVWTLSELFLSGPTTNCEIACDSNDDGFYDAGDAIYTANYVFLAGPAPVGPTNCGTTPGQTPEDCVSSNCVPDGGPDFLTFEIDVQPMLTASCMPCHTPTGSQGNGPSAGLQLTENALGNILGVASGECNILNLVTAGDSSGSWLFRKIAGTHVDQDILDLGCCADTDGDSEPDGCGQQMPRGPFCCLDQTTIDLVEAWIDQGAN